MNGRPASMLTKVALVGLIGFAGVAQAALTLVAESDVASRSLSIVAVSDQPVTAVVLQIFDDAAGTSPVTTATTVVDSAGVLQAHANGVVKATISNLSPETTYYLRLTVTASDGDSVFPDAGQLYGVTTANTPVALVTGANLAISELLSFRPYVPSTATDPRSVLVLLDVPILSPTPISAFVDTSAPVASVYFDGNNLLDLNGARLPVVENVDVRLREIRGLACPQAERVRFRRTPALTAVGEPLAFTALASCFFADTVCDDTVDVLDFQFLLNSFGSTTGECGFSPDLDIVVDDTIDVLDMQSILNRFGESAPFN